MPSSGRVRGGDVAEHVKEKCRDDHSRGESENLASLSKRDKVSYTHSSPPNIVHGSNLSSPPSSSRPSLSPSSPTRARSSLPHIQGTTSSFSSSSSTTPFLSSRRSKPSPSFSSSTSTSVSSRSLRSPRSSSHLALSTISPSLPISRTTFSKALHALGLAAFGAVFLICIGVLLYVSPVSASVPAHLSSSGGGFEAVGRSQSSDHLSDCPSVHAQRRDGGMRQ